MIASLPTGEEFLALLRERTEADWAAVTPRSLEAYERSGAGGYDWQPGTRWLGGLDEPAIAAAERHWGLRFPPEYRLFLRTLHTPDRPRAGYLYVDGSKLSAVERPSFYDWRPGHEGEPVSFRGLAGAFEWLYEGIFFSVQHGYWPPPWGPMPSTMEERGLRVRELIAAAPRLIPIIDHSYLLAEPEGANNPVFSIYGPDTIVYAATFRSTLLREFGHLLCNNHEERRMLREDILAERDIASGEPIPFWGELSRWCRSG